ncbi:MAG: alpha/beta fold hydrolase [Chloroflexi bacterium]|nr:alpha/beta fold hydrolase [Chloroflexota bacterium]
MPEFDRDGVTLFYETWGSPEAPAVVLLHGFTSDQRMWLPHVEAFAEDYRVIVPDLRGHGRSASPEDPAAYSMETYAEDLRALLDDVGADVCALIGCSFGGMVALQFATTWPERVAALVISDSSPAYDHPAYAEAFRERERRISAMAEVVRTKGPAALGKQAAAAVKDPFLAEGIRRRYRALHRDGFLGAESARRSRPDLAPLLRERLAMPVLLCWGSEDPVISAREVMAAELPGARVVVFERTGHGVPAIRPGPFTKAVLDFLGDVEDGKAVAGSLIV